MPLPQATIVNCFLDDYLAFRKPHWDSLLLSLYHTVTTLPTYYFSSQPKQNDKVIITHECEELQNTAKEAKNVSDWCKLCETLGNKARTAIERDPYSRFAQTLHALRTYILAQLQADPETKKKYQSYLQNHLTILKKEKQLLDDTLYLKQIQNAPETELELTKKSLMTEKIGPLLLILANLGHLRSIFEATRLGLFEGLVFPELATIMIAQNPETPPDINRYVPSLYQTKCYENHPKNLQMKEEFSDFLKRAPKGQSPAPEETKIPEQPSPEGHNNEKSEPSLKNVAAQMNLRLVEDTNKKPFNGVKENKANEIKIQATPQPTEPLRLAPNSFWSSDKIRHLKEAPPIQKIDKLAANQPKEIKPPMSAPQQATSRK